MVFICMKTKSFIFNPNEKINELDSKNTLVFAFYKRSKSKEAELVQSQFPNSTIIGCSSSGSILQEQIHEEQTVISVLKLEKSSFKKKVYTCSESDGFSSVGEKIGEDLSGENLKGIILLSEGLLVNGSKLIEGVNNIIKEKIYIGGGMAGDGMLFESTSVLDGNDSDTKKIIAVGLYGNDLEVISAYEGGWKNFGPTRKVSKSKNNVLFELDGKPALTLYKEFLGNTLSSQLPGSALYYPLSLTDAKGETSIRSILSVDEKTLSMTFAGDLPEGAQVRLMHSAHDGLTLAAEQAAQKVSNQLNQPKDAFILVISCVGRKVVLGDYTEDELKKVSETFPSSCISGFYSYGEFSVGKNVNCQLHNQTLTLVGIQEK